MRDINSEMQYIEFAAREREYRATWTETYYVTVTRTENFTAPAGDLDAIQEVADHTADHAAGNLEEYDLIDLLRSNGSHEYSDGQDVEVEFEEI